MQTQSKYIETPKLGFMEKFGFVLIIHRSPSSRIKFSAVHAQRTLTTLGRPCSADIPTEEDNAVAEITALLRGQDLPQLPFNLLRFLTLGQTQSAADADTMGIADNTAGDAI